MNSSSVLWNFKADKVLSALREGKRLDERKLDEYRKIVIQKGISENADASARVKIGETEAVVGIKIVPGTPFPDTPDAGTLSVGAEMLPIASPSFEAGPPRPGSIELARVVDRGIRESKCIDFKDLCIKEGEQVWTVFVDIYALNDDGNLFDAAAIGAMSSLLDAKIPKLEDNKIVKKEYKGKLKVVRKPILCTFAKIGNSVVVDPILAEEKAMTARLSTAITEDDSITAFQKGGTGSFSFREISDAIDVAMKQSKHIRKHL